MRSLYSLNIGYSRFNASKTEDGNVHQNLDMSIIVN